MVKFMKKYKKWLLLFSIIGAFIPVLPCEAKVEQTHEVELIDMGNGIWIPSSFDVVDENGNFVTLSNLDASFAEEKEIDTENYSITLDNGYRAEKQWFHTSTTSNVGYSRTVVYDNNNEVIFVLGCNESGQVIFGMQDEDGNYVKNTYTRDVAIDVINSEYFQYTKTDINGTCIVPLKRTTYNPEEQVAKNYITWGEGMQLDTKYDYSTEGSPTCTIYGKTTTGNPYDKEDEFYEAYSYKYEDIREYSPMTMVGVVNVGDVYMPYHCKSPYKIMHHGEELYICWLNNYLQDNGDYADEDTRVFFEKLDGRPLEMKYYFTKEQLEIIEKEGITSVNELRNRHPEFLETFKGYVDTYVGTEVESEEERKEREAQEAIIVPDVETGAEPEYDGKWQTLPDGTKVCWQDLTGDVVPINGMVPTKVMSQEFETPSGMRQSVILYDDNGNIVMHCVFFDMSHTDYKYVYLTRVDLAMNMAEIAGTDTHISGNLDYFGETTYDTENGQVTDGVYDEYYYEPGGEY